MNKLKDKVAIVTGGPSGIRVDITRQLAAGDARVIVNYMSNGSSTDKIVIDIEAASGRTVAAAVNVTNPSEVEALINSATGDFGRLDIVVSNADIYQSARIEDSTEVLYHRRFDVNVLGLLLLAGAATPHLDKGSSIINTSSFVTRVAIPKSATYSGTRDAIDATASVPPRELDPRGIRINAVSPGLTGTEGNHILDAMNSDFQIWNEKQTPPGRIGQVQGVAPIISFLTPNDTGQVTGKVTLAPGGTR